MVDMFNQGGSVMMFLLLLGVFIVILTIKALTELFVKKQINGQTESSINSILFWGGISAGLGIFGHFNGIFLAMQRILEVRDTSPAIVADGYMMAFSNIVFGLLILLIASLIWLILKWRFKKKAISF
jgi:hypothetical protein